MKMIFLFSLIALFFFLMGLALTPYIAVSIFAYLCLVLGLVFRQTKKIHVILMSIGIFLDFSIVLILEFTRQAIDTTFSMTLNSFQQLHIFFSSITILLYFPVFIIGLNLYRGSSSQKLKNYHKVIGIIAFTFRTLGFFFMFSMIK